MSDASGGRDPYFEALEKADAMCAARLGTDEGQVGAVAREFADTLYRQLESSDRLEGFERRFERCLDEVAELRYALNPACQKWDVDGGASKAAVVAKLKAGFGTSKHDEVIWPFPDPAKAHMLKGQEAHDWPHDQAGLKTCAFSYMGDYWGYSATFERILIAALAYSEANTFSQSVRLRRYGRFSGTPKPQQAALLPTLAWRLVGGIFWLAIGALLGMLVTDSHGPGAGIATFAIFMVTNGVRLHLIEADALRSELKEFDLLNDMFELCKATRFVNFSPAAIRSALESSSSKGAVWPTELWQLVLRAEDRCRWKI